ncbi:DUF1576 domain-containing protein [Dysosmobacter sp. Sow4_B12]|uniref:DUF1576 domain-containing protein n=1 Tax=Dysosmobacter sp. Sow4_B12 TaxID=3438777 RepID=UPI003F922BBB
MQKRYDKIFPGTICFSLGLMLLGVLMDDASQIPAGLFRIVTMQDLLITDYVYIAGPGAALVNAGLVTIISICIIRFSGDPYNGFTIVEMGLMAGFSLFGKNVLNIWPIILGTWLYARYQREPFSKYASVALLATSLAPLVSYMALGSIHASIPLGILTGIIIGFILPSLSAYTYKIQNGMNLYNMGFACGLFAMMVVPILTAFGDKPDSVLYWAEGYNKTFIVILGIMCVSAILLGLFATSVPPWAVWAGYRRLLSTTGRAPSDYLRMFGAGPVMLNIGFNGILGILYVLIIGGDLNGPTVGGIFTIMGFSAFGKHPFNITPVMIGVALGAYGMHYTPDYPALQLAGLFGTTLAPIAGHFGWPFGILAGFIHSALVLQTGSPVAGLNLYNNGFSGGLIAIVLYPTITAIWKHRRPTLRDEDYYDLFEESAPIDTSFWRTKRSEGTHHSTHEMHPQHLDRDGPNSRMSDDVPEESEVD